MKFDLYFPATPVMINLMHTEQMSGRPKESQISMGLFIPEFLQRKGAFPSLERSSLSFQSLVAWCPNADHLARIIPHTLSAFLHH